MSCIKLLGYLAVLASLAMVTSSAAANAPRNVNVPPDQVIEGNYYGVGDTVEVAGTVESDVIVVGGNVLVSGNVGGDVIATGGKVRITGTVAGNLRAVGGTVEVASSIGRNVLVGAGELVLNESSIVLGHITAGAGSLELRGLVEGGVMAGAGTVFLAGEVRGPIKLWLDKQGSLEVRDGAVTADTFTYYSSRAANIATGAKLAQAPTREPWPVHEGRRGRGWWWGGLVWLFGLLVLGMVLMNLLPRKLAEVVQEALSRPGPSLGWGLVWAVATPIVVVLLLVTIIGIPLAVVLVALYIIGLLIAQVVAGATIGWFMQKQLSLKWLSKFSPLWLVMTGIVVYRLLLTVPVLGGLIGVAVTLWAWGALLQVQKRTLASFR